MLSRTAVLVDLSVNKAAQALIHSSMVLKKNMSRPASGGFATLLCHCSLTMHFADAMYSASFQAKELSKPFEYTQMSEDRTRSICEWRLLSRVLRQSGYNSRDSMLGLSPPIKRDPNSFRSALISSARFLFMLRTSSFRSGKSRV